LINLFKGSIHFYTANKTINDIFLKILIFEIGQTNWDKESIFFKLLNLVSNYVMFKKI